MTRLFCPLLAATVLCACAQVSSPPQQCVDWVNAFYFQNPPASFDRLASAWVFLRAKIHDENIKIFVQIPQPMNGSTEERKMRLKGFCPSRGEEIWSYLPLENNLVIEARTLTNSFSESVTC